MIFTNFWYVYLKNVCLLFFQYYPRWLAPNVLTLAGFCLLVVSFVVLTFFDPHFYAASPGHPDNPGVPHWVWLFCSFNVFWSHTLGEFHQTLSNWYIYAYQVCAMYTFNIISSKWPQLLMGCKTSSNKQTYSDEKAYFNVYNIFLMEQIIWVSGWCVEFSLWKTNNSYIILYIFAIE